MCSNKTLFRRTGSSWIWFVCWPPFQNTTGKFCVPMMPYFGSHWGIVEKSSDSDSPGFNSPCKSLSTLSNVSDSLIPSSENGNESKWWTYSALLSTWRMEELVKLSLSSFLISPFVPVSLVSKLSGRYFDILVAFCVHCHVAFQNPPHRCAVSGGVCVSPQLY